VLKLLLTRLRRHRVNDGLTHTYTIFSPEDGAPFLQRPPSLQGGRCRVRARDDSRWTILLAAGRLKISRDIIPAMNEKELTAQLQREGFSHTYVWEDGPNVRCPDHAHATETGHIILRGEMTLVIGGKSKTYRVDERYDVPAGAAHAANMGPAAAI
jgi:mannose-6-phosphate isomerase-like protein (cupin superfamily)